MESLYEWLKSLVFFYLLMTAVLHLLPRKSYQKYVRFYGGILMAILLCVPLLRALGQADTLLERISMESFQQEMEEMELSAERMELWQQQAYEEKYQELLSQNSQELSGGAE
jgi:stage III sporulation protein AF